MRIPFRGIGLLAMSLAAVMLLAPWPTPARAADVTFAGFVKEWKAPRPYEAVKTRWRADKPAPRRW